MDDQDRREPEKVPNHPTQEPLPEQRPVDPPGRQQPPSQPSQPSPSPAPDRGGQTTNINVNPSSNPGGSGSQGE